MKKHAKNSKESIEIHLRYEGPDVVAGSMSIEDIVPVLQGFSSAYGKLANINDPDSIHKIRITGVKPGSADIVLEVWKFLGENVNSITSTGVIIPVGYYIVKKILSLISLKRHTKKKPYGEKIVSHDKISITNIENITIEIPLDIYELFKNKTIDSDLSKIVRPLEKDRIDIAKISISNEDSEMNEESISADERPYFEVEEVYTTSTKETWLTIKLNSLTKSTNSGYAYLSDGSRVFYQYIAKNHEKLYKLFSYSGAVRAYCVAHMDENLKVSKLEIYNIEKTQSDLFDSNSQSKDM